MVDLDIAKSVFQVDGGDAEGKVFVQRKLTRAKLVPVFETLPPCLVGIEACAAAHHWGRRLGELGHEVNQCAIGPSSPCFWSGPSFAEGIMASGPCAAPTGRRHGRTDHCHNTPRSTLPTGSRPDMARRCLALTEVVGRSVMGKRTCAGLAIERPMSGPIRSSASGASQTWRWPR